jgi:GTPase SAR1 family protein
MYNGNIIFLHFYYFRTMTDLKNVGTQPPKEINGTAKILIAGPAHSGKSIAENFLRNILPQQETMRIAAQPDGEGDWTQNLYKLDAEQAKELRKKGTFSRGNIEAWKQQIVNSNSRFTLIDVGGVASEENKELAEQANSMIIISSNPEKTKEWVEFANAARLNIIAVLDSTLDPNAQEYFVQTSGKNRETEGVVKGLDRETFKDSDTLKQLASYLLNKIPAKEKKEIAQYETISITDIAKAINKQDEMVSLPGREPIMQLNRKPEDLAKVYQSLQEMAEKGGNYVIDGRAPQYLVVDVLHALHPNNVALADSKVEGGMVGIAGKNTPSGL